MSGTLRTSAYLLNQFRPGQIPARQDPQDIEDLIATVLAWTSVTPNTQTSSYTLVLADGFGTCVEYNSASAGNLFIPTDASVAFPVGTVIEWFQMGVGQLTIVAVTPGTTTVRNSSSNTARAQNSSGAIRKRAANDWVLMGEVT